MEMQFGGPPMGIVRQPPPTSILPPQANMQHQASMNQNPPPWIKPVGSQQMEVEQSKLTIQDMDTSAEPVDMAQPIEEVKMDICDTWEQEKVQRLTEEVEKFEQEVMNIEKSSKTKDTCEPITKTPEKLVAKDDKPENLATTKPDAKDDDIPEKLVDNKLDELAVEDNKPDEPEKLVAKDDNGLDKLAAEDKLVELAAKVYKPATETQSEPEDSKTEIGELDIKEDATLDNKKEDLQFETGEDTKKPENPKKEISKELPTHENNEYAEKRSDGTNKEVTDKMMEDTKVDESIPSNEIEDNIDHMLEAKFAKLDDDALEQQPGEAVEGENKETKCDGVKGEKHHSTYGDVMGLQDSSSETNEPSTGDA